MIMFSHFLVHLALLFVLLPLELHNLLIGVSSATLSITTDREALISFKSQLSNDTLNYLSSWNHNSSPCNWTGVLCDRLGQRVTGLHLSGLELSGHLSPYIGNLSSLQSLKLQNNQLTGVIPDQIGNLFSLRILNMSFNMLEGKLPSNITHLNELQVLDLSSNRIVSKVTEDFSNLKKLQVLKLGKNNFYGAIPASLGNMSSLKNISFGTNSLTGWIPSGLGRLHDLIELDLTFNNLNGTVPPVIYNLSSLVNFAIASNSLSGEIPQDVGHKLPKLVVFNICFNYFTGGIPGSLHNLTNIQVIRLASNHLGGSVPPGLGNLPFLRMYVIRYNRIVSSGVRGLDFITSLTNNTQLNFLAIDNNMLEGVIPQTIGNLSENLSILNMAHNHFNGSIPSSIGRLNGLKLLNLSYNSISGKIPHELGKLQELQELFLAGNEISGGIPNSLGNLLKLINIDLSRNRLVGEIPTNFGNLQNLLYMDLSSNQLNGSIPMEILNLPTLSNILNLSMNFLSGPIPEDGRLSSVAALDFSSNQLYGGIPSSLSNCHSLEKLLLSRNQLSGPIPKALGDVKGLETLDLSSNQLSGTIPIELQNVHGLKLLNLSYNYLEGPIPSGGVFQNLSAVYLQGNRNLCLHFHCPPHGRGSINVRVYIIIAIMVTVIHLTIGILLHIKNKKVKVTAATSEQLKPHALMISYGDLRRATEKFSQENLIGIGSFGSVYKGHLSRGTTVAVKVLDTLRTGSLKSFFAECEAMRNSRHRNLVKLINSCSSVDFKNNCFLALVYEYLCNGSLEDWIKGRRKYANGNGLNLIERMNIAIDIACALDYLHNDSEIPVVHCDLKPSNILLDEDMTAKVGDFGLARLLIQRSPNQVSIPSNSNHVLTGSVGYIPPEYGWGEKPSAAGDVYSFGIVLLELFSGKSPTDECFTEDLSIRRWMQSASRDKTMQVIDPMLLSLIIHDDSSKAQLHCVDAIVGIAISCAADNPHQRIGIRYAVRQLKAIRDSLSKMSDSNESPTPTTDTNSYFNVSLT